MSLNGAGGSDFSLALNQTYCVGPRIFFLTTDKAKQPNILLTITGKEHDLTFDQERKQMTPKSECITGLQIDPKQKNLSSPSKGCSEVKVTQQS